MNKFRVFADFHNADVKGKVRLNCAGTIADIERQVTRRHRHTTNAPAAIAAKSESRITRMTRINADYCIFTSMPPYLSSSGIVDYAINAVF